MVTCTECEKKFRTKSGLRWHLNNPNGPHSGMSQAAIDEVVKKATVGDGPQVTVQQGQVDNGLTPGSRLATEQQWSQFDDIQQTVEALTERVDDCEQALKELTNRIGDTGKLQSRIDYLEKRVNTLEGFHKIELLASQIKTRSS